MREPGKKTGKKHWNQKTGIREPVYRNRDKRLEIEDWNKRTGMRELRRKNRMQEPK